ncbi:FG-GAP-like repeat-containing protein, partial [Zavarzinia sp.]|uniref:FG-GAP-like repeat-containing protein n=1 Tax=Zavarzinia sp. TaxID=2027920 RepID=UPI003562E8AB
AIAEGNVLVVINQAGAGFTTRLSAAPLAAVSVSRSFDVIGPVATGDPWTVTLTVDGVAVTVSATAGASVAGLVLDLKNQIDALAGFKAGSIGTTLTISTEGANAGKAFSLTSTAPSGSIVEKAATTGRELVLFGPAVIGDLWSVTLTAEGVTQTVTRPVTFDLATLATDLATQINLVTGFTGLFNGTTVIVSTAGPNFGKGFSVSYAVTRAFANTPAGNATSSTIGLGRGVPVEGETWRVTIGATPYNHVVTAGQTLAQVAAALAKTITDTSGVDAAARGETIVVLGTATFSIPVRVNGAGSAAAYDGGTVVISGTPVAGDRLTVNLGSSTHVHVMRETVPLAEIAAGLAARINAASNGFTALVEGDTLVVVDTNASGAAMSFQISSAGTISGSVTKTVTGSTTRFALVGTSRIGETWRVTIGGTNHDYVVESPAVIAAILAADINANANLVRAALTTAAPVAGELWTVSVDLAGNLATAAYSALAGDSLADVIAGLAKALNALAGTQFSAKLGGADLLLVNRTAALPTVAFTRGTTNLTPVVTSDANFVAAAEGTKLVIVPLTGSFTGASTTVTPRNTLSSANAAAATVAPSATPVVGETWTVTIGGAKYSHVVQSVNGLTQTVAQIATAIAEKINTGVVRGYAAFVDGNVLFIARADNAVIAPTFDVVPAARIDVDAATPTSRVVNFGAQGTTIADQTWYVQIGTAGGVFAYGYKILAGDDLADVSNGLALVINAHTAGGFKAIARNLTGGPTSYELFIVDAAGRAFTASFQIGLADGTVGGGAVLLAPAPAAMLELSGTAAVGETWSVALTFGGITRSYGHQVVAGDFFNPPVFPATLPTLRTPTEVASALASLIAAAINEDLDAGFSAVTEGAKLIITNRLGISFTAQGVLLPTLRPAGSVDLLHGTDAAGNELLPAIDMQLAGTPVTGAIWNLRLKVGGNEYSFDYAVTTGQSLQAIAAGFAALVNAAALPAGSPLAGVAAQATATGSTLVIADLGGRALASSVSLVTVAAAAIDGGSATTTLVDLIGTPVAGELWRLRIDNALDDEHLRYGITIAGTPQTLSELASAFAALINADDPAAARYTVLVADARIIIVDRDGGPFDIRLEAGKVTRAEGYADVELDYSLPAVDTDASDGIDDVTTRLRALYGSDDIVVTEARNAGDVTYTISFVREQAGIDKQQIRWTETAQTTGLVPSPNASVDVRIATLRNGATVNAGINNLQTVTVNPNVTGGSFTLSFRIENERGVLEVFKTGAIAYNATALDVFKALSPILNPDGATMDIDPDFDFATRTPSRPYTDNFAVRKVGNVFLITFQGAHRYLAIHDIDTRLLTTQETAGADEHEALITSVALGRTEGFAELDPKAPRATTVDLNGQTTGTAKVWSVTVSLRGVSSTHAYTAASGDSQTAIAAQLAASINASAADVFTAVNDGGVLVIVNRDGGVFKTSFTVAGVNIGVAAIDRSTPTEAAVNLTGKPATGEVWQIALSDGATTPTVHGYTVAAGNTLETIAAGIAAAINGGAHAEFAAVAEGSTVLIVRRDGTLFAATPRIAAAGQPQLGQSWAVTLQSATSGPLSFSHTVVAADATHATVARALADQINLLGLPEFRATDEDGVLHIENIAGNVFTTGYSVDAVARPNDVEAGTALIATRVDGINYYEIETLGIELGAGDDVLNVQGTTAVTNIDSNGGDDRIHVSSAAAASLDSSIGLLAGHLHHINGALNIDAGTGSNQLMVSGESSTLTNSDIVISDVLIAGEPANAEIAVRGLAGGDNAYGWVDLAQATITYRADAAGSFANGVTLWSGFGADTVWIDGTLDRAGVRSITTLNTGLGDDTVYVNLQASEANGPDTTDGILVLNTQGPWNDYPTITDNDTVLGTATGAANPLAGIDVVAMGTPSFADLDNDGDKDVVVGAIDGTLRYFRNTGTAAAPVYVELTAAANPFDGIDVGDLSVPSLADLDGDGDLDVVVGGNDGMLRYFRNTGTASAPAYAELTGVSNPFNGIDAGIQSTPSFVDLDNDGDRDLVVGEFFGSLKYFQNTGTPAAPVYVERTGALNPFDGLDVGNAGKPSFVDLDGDGDLDAVVGESGGTLKYFQNTGTAAAPVYAELIGAANPLNVVSVGVQSAPSLADLDNDGDLDLVVGESFGRLKYFENTGTTATPAYLELVGAFASTLPLVVFGGQGDDTITGGSANDILFGDRGRMVSFEYLDGLPTATIVEQQGGGGPGDLADGMIRHPDQIFSVDLAVGGNDTIHGLEGANVVVGGFGVDTIETGAGTDVILGDNGFLEYTTTTSNVVSYVAASNQITVETGDLDAALVQLGVATLADLVGMGFEVTLATNGTALGQAPLITGVAAGGTVGTTVLTLDAAFNLGTGSAADILGYLISSATNAGLVVALTEAGTTDTISATGAGDFITTGDGVNIVLAGVGGDTITGGSVADLVIGDNGQFNWDSTGLLTSFSSTDTNPFNGIDVGADSTPAFADLDRDGDLDLAIGAVDGTLSYFENIGTTTAPVYVARSGAANPFDGLNVGADATPSLADLDGDGDLDAVIGAADGTLHYIENTGTATAPVYVLRSGMDNPFDGAIVGAGSTPSVADIDGDGDLDAVVGAADGSFSYYENTGTAAAPVYVLQSGADNPFDAVNIGAGGTANLADVDGDGDLDALVGSSDGTLRYYENTGTATAPVYVERTGAANPYDGLDVGAQSTPILADLDGDGDLDLASGESGGTLKYYPTTDPVIGGDDIITLGEGDNIALGGFGNDTITTGSGADIILGDNGAVSYIPGTTQLLQATSTDLVNGTGGIDTIITGDGNNLILAGVGADNVTAGAGLDLVMGDNGEFNWGATTGLLESFMSTDPILGGNDVILVGEGDNIVVGGFGSDTITSGSGTDILLGDNGAVSYTPGTTNLLQAVSTDPVNATGGNDTIIGGDGENPLGGVVVGAGSTPSFADIDGDGDLDAIMGAADGTLSYFENTGTAAAPVYVETTGAANPLAAVNVGADSTASFADIDGDGDLDAIVGAADGTLSYFENTGTAAAPVYVQSAG